MTKVVNNFAEISYNNKTPEKTCSIDTWIDPNLKIKKSAITDSGITYDTGVVGPSRKVKYQVHLINYSHIPFTNVVVEDFLMLPAGVTHEQIEYIQAESSGANEAVLPNIKLTVGTIPERSDVTVYYTIKFKDTVETGSIFKNQAKVNYKENTTKDKDGNIVPIKSNIVTITLQDTTTSVKGVKTGPKAVLCGQDFDYVLTYTNLGNNTATSVKIEDTLPEGYSLKSVKIENDGTPLMKGKEYNYTFDHTTKKLLITSIGAGLDIKKGKKLIVTIKGDIAC